MELGIYLVLFLGLIGVLGPLKRLLKAFKRIWGLVGLRVLEGFVDVLGFFKLFKAG